MSSRWLLYACLVLAILVSTAASPLAQPSLLAAGLTVSVPPPVENRDDLQNLSATGAIAYSILNDLETAATASVSLESGTDTTFTTSAPGAPEVVNYGLYEVSATSAILCGYLVSLGSAASVTASFVYGTTAGGPYPSETIGEVMTASGDSYYGELSGLTPGAAYYYRPMVVGDGTAYGAEESFTTKSPAVPPSVTTDAAGNLTATSADLCLNVTDFGTAYSVNVYCDWGLTTSYGNTTPLDTRSEPGDFAFIVGSLTPDTTYHFRAVAIGDGVGYGDDMEFATPAVTAAPWVETAGAGNLTANSATLNGTLSTLGSATVVNVSFQYGTAPSLYGRETPAQAVTSAGDFAADVSGLESGTIYYYRAKAVGDGTAYGGEWTFITPMFTPPPGSHSFAVIVGVGDYEYADDLRYTDDDARQLYDVLSPAWGESYVRLLTNENATKAGIQKAIAYWLAPLEDADDTVIFFFSGHGGFLTYDQAPLDEADGRDEYMVPYDGRYAKDMVLDDELRRWLGDLESSRQAIIIASCHSGGFIGSGFAQDLTRGGRVVLTATEEDEVGWETSDLDASVFPYYLLDALENLDILDTDGNNKISAEELFAYAQPRTTDYESAHDFESIQHPQMYDGYEGDLDLITLATLTINASEPLTSVTLDGQTYSPSDLPVSVDFLPGTNRTFTFGVSATIESGVQQTKYTFLSWDDGVTSGTRTVSISASASYVAEYMTQYYLTIKSEHGSPRGAGWYSEGATAEFSIDSSVSDGDDVRHVFAGWTGNSTAVENPSAVIMNSPKTINAIWRTQCRATVTTAPPGAAPAAIEGWHDEGATFTTATADAIVEGSPGTRYVFSSWSVDGVPVPGNPIAVNMDSPHVVTALYATQHLLTVLSDEGTVESGDWYDAGSEVSISARRSSGVIVRRVFSGFEGDCTANTAEATILMDGPKTVHVLWHMDYTQLYILLAGMLAAGLAAAAAITVIVWRRRRHARLPQPEQPATDT